MILSPNCKKKAPFPAAKRGRLLNYIANSARTMGNSRLEEQGMSGQKE